ncbi:MAG: hypothetical protein ABI835_07385 [Chloroflexota bacterium]
MTLDAGIEQLRVSPHIQSIAPVASELNSPAPAGLYEVEFVPTLISMRTARMQFLTEARSGVIENILLTNTSLQLSDIFLTLGQPASLILDNPSHLGLVTYVGFYPDYQMYVQVVLPICASDDDRFWNVRQNVSVGIASTANYVEQSGYYSTTPLSNGEGWLQQLHNMKRTNCTQSGNL